jgi:hypothetical protein
MQSPPTDEIVQRLREWRQAHPQATFDEIDEEVSRQFAGLQAQVVAALSQPEHVGADETRASGDDPPDPPRCPQCQSAMQHRGHSVAGAYPPARDRTWCCSAPLTCAQPLGPGISPWMRCWA